MQSIFREQAAALEERGVDLFILETFSDLDELIAAIAAIRSFSRLPIVAQLTYSEEGSTFGGTRPAEAWEKLKSLDVQAVGANCTIGPQLLLPVLRDLAAAAHIPLSAMPNAGFPHRMGDRIVYPKSSPEYFALFAREAAELGVRLLGGCCGTTPEHIRAMADVAKSLQPATHVKVAGATVTPVEKARRISAREPESKLWKKIQSGKFAVSVEIDPPKGISTDRILEQVGRVMDGGKVDAIDINSGTLARVGMDALMLAGALEAHGYETIPHLTSRDSNIIGLQAMLLGAWAIGGVRNVLAITGDPPSLGDHPETSGVYEVDSIGRGENNLAPESRHRLGRKKSRRRHKFHNRRSAESRSRRSRRRNPPLRTKAGSRRALRHDPTSLRSRTLAIIPEKVSAENARAGASGHLAANELQASPAPKQRSSRHSDSRSNSEGTRKRRKLSARPRLRPSKSNAGLGPHRSSRRLSNPAIQALRRSSGAPVGEGALALPPFGPAFLKINAIDHSRRRHQIARSAIGRAFSPLSSAKEESTIAKA